MKAGLNYFVGKVCSVFTTPTNRNLEKEAASTQQYLQNLTSYFVGRVESIDERGITLVQVGKAQKSFMFFPNVVAIAEETTLDPQKDSQLIEKMKESANAARRPTPSYSSPFIDPAAMANLARQAQQPRTTIPATTSQQ